MAIKVSGFFLPVSPTLPFILEDKYLRGGYRVLATSSDRDAIPQLAKKPGMLVYTQAEATIWKLENDGTWSSLLGTLVDAKVSKSGDTLSGPLVSRVPPGDGTQPFTSTEFIPKSEVSAMVTSGLSAIPAIDARVTNLESKFFTSTISNPSTQWAVQHDLASTSLIVEIYEGSNKVFPSTISYIDGNNIVINFSSAKTGVVMVMAMD